MLEFLSVHWLPIVVAVVIFVLFVYFLLSYVLPAWKLGKDLSTAVDATKQIHQDCKSREAIPNLPDVAHSFAHNDLLTHLWSEYTETVHEQLNHDRSLKALRATVPAETFFNTAVIVDTKLNTEFFKHLPGILTGIGIIGTFTGLLIGLDGFSPDTTDVNKLSEGLKNLMGGVQEAFYASAGAIFAAMLVTFIEKIQLNRRYKQVEELAQAVDALYDAGAGEEYLRELVESSQQNQAHTAQLKDAMVNDLKTMLENLGTAIASSVQSAIAEQTVKQEETNQKLVTALTDGMQPAINRMEEAVQQLAGQQSSGVEKFIDAAIEGAKEQFGSQLKAFGDSLSTASLLLAENMPKITEAGNNMQMAGDKINAAGDSIEQAGNSTAKNINESGVRFSETSKSLDETAQSIIRAQAGISDLVQAASDAASKLSALQDIFEKLGNTVIDLDNKAVQGSIQYQQGASDLAALQEPIQEAIKTLANVSNSLTSGIVEPIQTALDEMKRVVVSGADKINSAGGTLQNAAETAATSITTAGQSLSKDLNGSASGIQQAAQEFNQSATNWQGISSQIASVAQSLDHSSSNIKDAASTVQGYLSQYEQQNSNVTNLIKQVSDMVSQAKAQGELGQQQVRQMTELVAQMRTAQQEAAKFGEEVSGALTKAFESFTKNLTNASTSNASEYQKKLGEAVQQLAGVTQVITTELNKIKKLANPAQRTN